MAFVQIIEVRTKRFDELNALREQWEEATEGRRTLRRSLVLRDRDNPDRHLILAFFDSYESAMENSNLPETAAFADKQTSLLDAPPAFQNFDIVDEQA